MSILLRTCAPSVAVHRRPHLVVVGEREGDAGIAATGIRFDEDEPDGMKMSSAPERTWLSMSVSPPSWLFGKIWISTRAAGLFPDPIGRLLGTDIKRMGGREFLP